MIVEESLRLQCEPNAGWDPRVTVAKCGEMVRAYLIATERFVLVYDTLLGPKSGAWLHDKALALAQGRPLVVFNSHADWDHYFGNMCFPDATIISSHLCAERITGGVGAAELAKKVAEHPRCYGEVRLLAPTITVEGATTLRGGDLTVQVIPTIGHRPDHLALYIPEIRTLFPGDCVEDPIPLIDEDSQAGSNTVSELQRSLESMEALDPEWVLANHAAPQRGLERLRANRRYLEVLQESARRLDSLDALTCAHPAKSEWASFYQQAHSNHLEMAWQQRG